MVWFIFAILTAFFESMKDIFSKKGIKHIDEYIISWSLRFFALLFTLPVVINQAPLLALWVSIYYLILQQVEINVLVPYIMNKAVGLSPIIIIFVMLVGSQYLGILGLVISIPIATSVAIFVKDYMEKAK